MSTALDPLPIPASADSSGAAAFAPPGADEQLSRGALVTIGVLAVSVFVVFLSEMLLGVALPVLMEDLHVTASTGQWLTTAYALTMAVLIPTTGFAMQRFQVRTLFVLSMGTFTFGTALCAAAPGFEVLLLGRIVQAVGTAVMLPMLMSVSFRLVHVSKRGQVMAVVTAVGAVAPALGPAVSGVVVANMSWRWLLILMLPLAAAALAAGAWQMRNVTTPQPTHLDTPSLALTAIGFGALVYGLSSTGSEAADSAIVPFWVSLTIGAVGLAAFVVRQRRLQSRDAALLDMRIFAHRGFRRAAIVVSFMVTTAFGVSIILPTTLQGVMDVGALETGLLMVPGGAAIALVSALVGRLYAGAGARRLAIPGALMVCVALWSMSMMTAGTPLWTVLLLHLLLCSGQAFMWTATFTLALEALPDHLNAHGSAALSTIQQLAAAAGVAVLIAVMGSLPGLSSAAATDAAQNAFTVAGIISLGALAGVIFLPRRGTSPALAAETRPT